MAAAENRPDSKQDWKPLENKIFVREVQQPDDLSSQDADKMARFKSAFIQWVSAPEKEFPLEKRKF